MTRVQRDLFVKNAQETDPWLWRMWAMHVLTGLRRMLGHKDINLTAGTYTRNVDANQAGALDSLDPAGLSAL